MLIAWVCVLCECDGDNYIVQLFNHSLFMRHALFGMVTPFKQALN